MKELCSTSLFYGLSFFFSQAEHVLYQWYIPLFPYFLVCIATNILLVVGLNFLDFNYRRVDLIAVGLPRFLNVSSA